MRKIKNIQILIFLILTAAVISGESFLQKEDLIIGRERIVDDIVRADSSVMIRGQVYGMVYTVNSDVYIGAKAAVKGDIIVIGGSLTINPNVLIGSKFILIGADVVVEGVSDGLKYLKDHYKVSYSEEKKQKEIEFMRKYLIYERPIPRIGNSAEMVDLGFLSDLNFKIKNEYQDSLLSIDDLAEIDLSDYIENKRDIFLTGGEYDLEIKILELTSIKSGDELWAEVRKINEDKVNYSCHIAIGDGAHWFFRYKKSMYILWNKKNWLFSVKILFKDDSKHSAADWDEMERVRNNIISDIIKSLKRDKNR